MIPDYMEPLTGWRVWRLLGQTTTNGDEWRLASVHRGMCFWPCRMPFRAECGHSRDVFTAPHADYSACYAEAAKRGDPVPVTVGSIAQPWLGGKPACGIYANKLVGQAWEEMTTLASCAVGTVSLWGRVYEHKRGYRAEYAYPQAIYTAHRAASKLADAYGIPVHYVKNKHELSELLNLTLGPTNYEEQLELQRDTLSRLQQQALQQRTRQVPTINLADLTTMTVSVNGMTITKKMLDDAKVSMDQLRAEMQGMQNYHLARPFVDQPTAERCKTKIGEWIDRTFKKKD